MEHRWRAWLAENLLLGVPEPDLRAPLVAAGHSEEEVEAELARIAKDPYMEGARKIARRLQHRHWVLRTLCELSDLAPIRLDALSWPKGETFLAEHYARSRPGFFPGAAAEIPAVSWTPEGICDRFAEREVEVQWGRSADPDYEPNSNRYRRSVPFSQLRDAITGGPTNDVYLTANNARRNTWLLEALAPEALPPTLEPLADILDPKLLVSGTFLWIGPQGVLTPLHHDLTNNLFLQVAGRKRFYLAPVLQSDAVYNHHHVYSRASLRQPDLEALPDLSRVQVYEVELGPGDLLFLPVGWWHEVEGLTPSISLTFTGFRWTNHFPLDS